MVYWILNGMEVVLLIKYYFVKVSIKWDIYELEFLFYIDVDKDRWW